MLKLSRLKSELLKILCYLKDLELKICPFTPQVCGVTEMNLFYFTFIFTIPRQAAFSGSLATGPASVDNKMLHTFTACGF